jgi:hypothetical protein
MLAVQMPNSHRLEVAPALVAATFKDADRELEARVAEWLAQDPEPLPIVRLMVLDRPSDPPIGIRELAAGTGSNVQTSAARTAWFQAVTPNPRVFRPRFEYSVRFSWRRGDETFLLGTGLVNDLATMRTSSSG